MFEDSQLKESMCKYYMSMISLFMTKNIAVNYIDSAIISSVVPSLIMVLNHAIFQIIYKYSLVVGPGVKTGLQIRTDDSYEIGAEFIA